MLAVARDLPPGPELVTDHLRLPGVPALQPGQRGVAGGLLRGQQLGIAGARFSPLGELLGDPVGLLGGTREGDFELVGAAMPVRLDRKSTRLNSSHANISYAVFCL